MRIAVLIDRLRLGGVEKVAIEEVRAFRKLGEDASLVVLRREGSSFDAFEDIVKDIPLVFLDDRLPRLLQLSVRVPYFYFFSTFHITYALLLPFHVRRDEFDAVLSHGTFTSLTALGLRRIRGIPYLIYVWDPIDYILQAVYRVGPLKAINGALRFVGRAVDRLLVRGSEGVLVSGRSHVPYLERIAGRQVVRLLPPGCNPAASLAAERGDYVLAVTAWKEGKNLEFLLTTMRDIGHGTLYVGGGWVQESYRSRITELIEALGLTDRIRILGHMSEDGLRNLYSRARVTVIPESERGFGLAGLEAAANGCSFVATSDSGVSALFEDREDCRLFEAGDRRQIRSILETFLADEALATRMGRRAWMRARQSLQWHHHCGTAMSVLRSSLARNQG